MPTDKYRIAYIDIETAPNVGYTWGKYEQDVIAFIKEWYILSFAVLWSDEKKPTVYTLQDFPLYDKERDNDRDLVKELWKVCDSADLIVAHNGDRFDLRKSNARFLVHGFTPPAPYKTVDTLKVARKQFALNSNKLNDIATALGIGQKVETGGFKLWLGCMSGDAKAWSKMAKYNAQDVVLLKKVYDRLKPWHTSHPNIALLSEDLACPACGSRNVQRRGYTYLAAYRAQRYCCLNCGKWSKGKNERLTGTHLR